MGKPIVGAGRKCDYCDRPAFLSVERGGAVTCIWEDSAVVRTSISEPTEIEWLCVDHYERKYGMADELTWYVIEDI
jgi:hypothetical protein